MSNDSFQDTLFEDPIGLRFRHAREKARWSVESVAQQIKLPVSVLEAIEREDWARLGAPIFVRSYVGSYAKILGLPATLADDVVRGKPVPQLVSIGSSTPERRVDRGLMNLAYLVLTLIVLGAVVWLAMYFQSPRSSAEALPLDAPAAYAESQESETSGAMDAAATEGFAELAAPADAPLQSPGAETVPPATPAPAQALAAGSAPATPASSHDDIVLRFRGQSWVDIVDRRGTHLERGLVDAGTERRFTAEQLAQVTLGDAGAVDVSRAGVALDMAPYRDANVARFTVSSEGRIGPSTAD